MTLQTENVEIAGLNQVRIRGAMRRMARNATLCLDRLVFENEWSLLVDVASKADRILSRRGAQLLSDETTMRVMTIHALHQSFFHPVMKRHIELGLHLQVAGVAKPRLSFDQQELIRHSLVGRMATQAAQVILAMCRARKVRVIFAGAVAFKASVVDFLRRGRLETKDLAGVPRVIDVVTSWAVAGLAALFGRAAMLV